jgi:hypothetical protein
MDQMNATELVALVSAQRSAMLHDSSTSNTAASTETPTLKKAELVELLCDRAGLNAQEAKEMVAVTGTTCVSFNWGNPTRRRDINYAKNRSVRDAIRKPAKQFPSRRAGSFSPFPSALLTTSKKAASDLHET